MTPPEIDQALRRAGELVARGNFVAADFVAQDVLRTVPEHPAALNLVGVIAARVGLREHAMAYFERALKAAPQFKGARDNLEMARALPTLAAPGRERYLLIKSWGFGFWADVTHVLACLLLAEITGRIPVTHWGGGSLFTDGSGRDAFQLYFEPISRHTVDTLPSVRSGDVFPRRWAAGDLRHEDWTKLKERGPGAILFLARPETVTVSDFHFGVFDLLPWLPEWHAMHGKSVDHVYRYLNEKYLKPVAAVGSAVEAFHRKHLLGRPAIAVHVRGSDKRLEFPPLDDFNKGYFPVIDAEDSSSRIFLLTDDENLLDLFRSRYGERLIATESQRSDSDTGPHHISSMDKIRLGHEVMTDVYLALRCSKFIGNGRSNVSAIIDVLKDWRGSSTLLAPSQLRESNPYLYGG